MLLDAEPMPVAAERIEWQDGAAASRFREQFVHFERHAARISRCERLKNVCDILPVARQARNAPNFGAIERRRNHRRQCGVRTQFEQDGTSRIDDIGNAAIELYRLAHMRTPIIGADVACHDIAGDVGVDGDRGRLGPQRRGGTM